MKIESADIFIDIIDNYGDMGWVLEFLVMNHLPLFWNIVTNAPLKMGSFLEKSGCSLPSFAIIEKEQYKYANGSPLIILGLHAEVDLSKIPKGKSIIRVNYLSFDPWYRKIHNQDHILSCSERPIREVSYSPLSGTGGIWKYDQTKRTRKEWLSRMDLDIHLYEKTWIPLFCYEETLSHFDTRNIPENIVVFLIGNSPKENPLQKNILYFPWMKRDDFWDLIDLADICILRGEISSIKGLQSTKPYLWDMYKDLGGWNKDESKGFLEFINADSLYKNLHENINTGKSWDIKNILDIYQKKPSFHFEEFPNFQETLKNTLDSFGFSL